MLDPTSIRRQFPIFSRKIGGRPLIYLDSAATSQKPLAVLNRMKKFYEEDNANVHRGMHALAERSTAAYEDARTAVQKFLNARYPEEIIFTGNCTGAVNLVAKSWGRAHLHEGDTVVLSALEHHSNIVPWLQLKEELGVEVKWIDCDDHGRLRIDMLGEFLREGNVKLVSVTAQSNVLGVRPPLMDIIAAAHAHRALVLVDAAQSVSHHPTDVQALDCDFLAFSGHKLYGPSGIGVLYGKREHLESMPPFMGGGMMIREVHRDRFTPADIPQKFEAGTPPIAEAAGLAAAIRWLGQFSWENVGNYERALLRAAWEALSSVKELTVLGPPRPRSCPSAGMDSDVSGCLSFAVTGVHPHDLTEILGRRGICLRAGHHCAQPLHRQLGVTASTRLSVGIYNTVEEIKLVGQAIADAAGILRP